MNAVSGWEKALKESQFDLPQARWDALEARLRRRIREDVAVAQVPAPAPSWIEGLSDLLERAREWFAPAPARWAVAGSSALLVAAGILWLRPAAPAPVVASGFRWEQGQILTTTDSMTWNWETGRSTITLRQGSMRLEHDSAGQVAIRLDEGAATFHVEHRRPSESFQVAFGACRIEVVGTAFTITRDSLEASARILEGRVRFVGEGRDVFLDAGQELTCERPSGTASDSATGALPVAATVPTTPSSRSAVAPPSAADLAWKTMESLCATATEACTEARADFVRKHATDRRSPAIAWSWGQSAREAGQLRDALFAWDVAARAQERLGFRAILAASELRLGEFSDASRAARDLDALVPRLEAGSTLWTRAWTLRREAARQLGQAGLVATADSLLSAPRTVSGEP